MSTPSERMEAFLGEKKEKDFRGASRRLEAQLSKTPEEISAGFAGQQELGPPGLDNPFARAAVAEANTAGEKVKAFQKHFPEGDLMVSPVTHELLFRKDSASPYAKVDADILEKFEPLGDLIDFVAPDLGAIIGEIVTTKGGGSLIGLLLRQFVGGSVGDITQQGIQELRGVNEQTLEEIGTRAATQGTISMIGAGGGAAITKGVKVARGGGLFTAAPGSVKATAAAKRRGINQLTPGQATDAPLLQRVEGQAGAALPTIQRYYDAQNKQAADAVLSVIDKKAAREAPEALAEMHSRARGDILAVGRRYAKAQTLTEGGGALQKGIRDYDTTARGAVDVAYAEARKAGNATFSLDNVLEVAAEVEKGVKGATRETIDKRTGKVLLPAGEIRVSAPLEPELKKVVNDLFALDPKKITEKQLLAMRSRLYDLKTVGPNEIFRAKHDQAKQLYDAITDAVLNPAAVSSPRFGALWAKANKEAAKRFDTLEKLHTITAGQALQPAEMAFQFARPRQIDNLKMLRSSIPNKRFAEFQDSFKIDLLSKADNITKRLDEFDAPTLNMLLSREEQTIFRQMGKAVDKLNSSGLKTALEHQSHTGGLIKELLLNNNTAGMDQVFNLIKQHGGRHGKVGRSVRSGLIESIADDIIQKTPGGKQIDAKALARVIQSYEDKGLLKFLTKQDVELLGDLEVLGPFLKTRPDVGTSIMAASAARGFVKGTVNALTGQGAGNEAFQTVLEHMGIGAFFTGRFGGWLLRGTGRRAVTDKAIIKRATAALTLMATETGDYNYKDMEAIAAAASQESQ